MRRYILPLTFGAIATSAAAADFVDNAQVVSATPIVERVTETHEMCGNGPAHAQPQAGIAAPIVGGVAGAILGNQVGRGNGRTAATAAGAIAGAIVGNSIGNPQPRAEARCRMVESTRDVVNGYNVVYRYNGRDVATVLPYNPGPVVQVGVAVVQNAPPAAGSPPPPVVSATAPVPVNAPNVPPPPASNMYRY